MDRATVGADAADESGGGRAAAGTQLKRVGVAVYLGVSGFVAIYLWAALLGSLLASTGVALGPIARQALSSVALGLGTGTVAFFYLRWSGRGWSFVDVGRPTRRDVAYAVGGVLAIFGALYALDVLLSALDVRTAEHGIARQARQGDPAVLLALIPAAFLVVGPGEELLYRNVVQKSLYDALGRPRAVAVASLVFALVHVPAYYSPGTGVTGLAATLGVIFTLSLVLGVVYVRTDNVLVPAVVHGAYDAVLFAGMYLELTGVL